MTDFKIPASGDAAPDFCAGRSRFEVKTAGHEAQVLAVLKEWA